jgi:hypothetical protein
MTTRRRRTAFAGVKTAALGGLVLMLAVAGCGGTTPSGQPGQTSGQPGQTSQPGHPTSVTLGIYSGRPDPSWTLTDAQAAELSLRLGLLSAAFGNPPEGGLGYHGFTIVTAAAGLADRSLVAYRGAVAEPGPAARSYLVDAARSVERYLLDTGRSHLAPDEISAVEADLASP